MIISRLQRWQEKLALIERREGLEEEFGEGFIDFIVLEIMIRQFKL